MSLSELLNLGEQSSKMLGKAGIVTRSQLEKMGPVLAFLAAKQAGARPSLNLLWAIAGALTNTKWNQLAPDYKRELLQQLDKLTASRSASKIVHDRSNRHEPTETIRMNAEVAAYHQSLGDTDKAICELLASEICKHLPEAEYKIWHAHPVWFLDGNPIVGYSKLKNCVRLLFWSGQSFDDESLSPEGKFKAAEARYSTVNEIDKKALKRWLGKSRDIQWDYKNIVRRKGRLERLK